MTGFRDYFILKVFGLADSLLGAIKLNVHKKFRRYPGCILTHFSPMSHFYPPPPRKRQKTKGFLTFSGVKKCDIGLKWAKLLKNMIVSFTMQRFSLWEKSKY